MMRGPLTHRQTALRNGVQMEHEVEGLLCLPKFRCFFNTRWWLTSLTYSQTRLARKDV